MTGPRFSLILATVGRTAELDRLFDSLAAQSLRDFEVIVVDQNRDDRLAPHLERARGLGVAIRHLRHHPPNLAAARNAGIAAASGDWLGFPDDDCWYAPELLEQVARRARSGVEETAREEPAGIIVRWAEQGEPRCAAPVLSWERSRAFRDVPVSSITLFFRRTMFERIGGFDARFGIGQWFGAAEETDFILRALRAGMRIVYEPGARVHHHVAARGLSMDNETRLALRRRARGTGALYAKHALPAWVILRGLAAPVLRPILKGAFGPELAHGIAVTLGRLDGWLGWRRRAP
ncbi:MAG TPA: glycosyltransferase [Paucimonas sp.]|nr:glycosyltransferase [Paucimonas sp.]